MREGHHVIVHASFRSIRAAFPGMTIEQVLHSLTNAVGRSGSLVMPAFTYCFKKFNGEQEIFDRLKTPSKTGALSEAFRRRVGVTRTSSATHSFCIWGAIANEISSTNSPNSPLGKGSILEWLTNIPDSFVLIMGVDFSALSYGHYIEIVAGVPWADISPWSYLGVEDIGLSVEGEQKLHQIPGCSKSFVNFENFLKNKRMFSSNKSGTLDSTYISTTFLLTEGLKYFSASDVDRLCPAGECKVCDARRNILSKK
jgi:aminoglycoside N3'-acetyltransferase